MLMFWLLPFLLISMLTAASLTGRHMQDEVSMEMSRLKFSTQVCTERLDALISLSKAATYSRVINNAYTSCEKELISKDSFLQTANAELTRLYGRQNTVRSALFWLTEDPEIHTGMFNENCGGSYRGISSFWSAHQEEMIQAAADLDTGIRFVGKDAGHLYLVRNMLDSSYRTIGVIVLELNDTYCFRALTELGADTDVTIELGEALYVLQGIGLRQSDVREGQSRDALSGYRSTSRQLGMYDVEREDGYTLTAMVRYNELWPSSLMSSYRIVLLMLLILLVPMVLLMLYFFRNSITKPVQQLVHTVEEIRNGNLGYQSEHAFRIKEFTYLGESINKMSARLKYQFDHIYEEEVALREAQIMALEAHINPHFLNNTLEIINWEARLNGDEKVADMIGSLSVLTDAAMDRKKQSVITMREEMVSVNAYLDILKMRFGKRLTVINDLPEEIMDCSVPRLILQPIIENAVEHGAAKHGSGTVILSGEIIGDYLHLQIFNDGSITKEEKEKIRRLLAPDYDTSQEPSGSLGIANVNRRLKILYGGPCGLSVDEADGGGVVSTLIIYAGAVY